MRELKECVLAECIEEYEDCTERSEDIFEKGNVPHGWTVIAQLTDNKGKRDPEYQEPVGYAMVGEDTTIYFADAHDALAATSYPCVPVVLWRKARPEVAPMEPAAYRGAVFGAVMYYSPEEADTSDDDLTPLYRMTVENKDTLESEPAVLEFIDSDGRQMFAGSLKRVAELMAYELMVYIGTRSTVPKVRPLYAKKSEKEETPTKPVAWAVNFKWHTDNRVLSPETYASVSRESFRLAVPLFKSAPGGESANTDLVPNPAAYEVADVDGKWCKFFDSYDNACMFAQRMSDLGVTRITRLYQKKQ